MLDEGCDKGVESSCCSVDFRGFTATRLVTENECLGASALTVNVIEVSVDICRLIVSAFLDRLLLIAAAPTEGCRSVTNSVIDV